ncbi:hypothetical protein CHH83_02335 [Bacillus sp. 7586-K]|nr:hypothetical protein CHH83_02335 [Bacillus sp. 7586-K]
MDYSSGMGIEIPQWVITTNSAKKFWNVKHRNFTNTLTEECLFQSKEEASEKLKDLDFGYKVKKVKKYMDSNGTSIKL